MTEREERLLGAATALLRCQNKIGAEEAMEKLKEATTAYGDTVGLTSRRQFRFDSQGRRKIGGTRP